MGRIVNSIMSYNSIRLEDNVNIDNEFIYEGLLKNNLIIPDKYIKPINNYIFEVRHFPNENV